MKRLLKFSLIGLVILNTGCSKAVYVNKNPSGGAQATATATATVNIYVNGSDNDGPVVCDPLTGGNTSSQLQSWNGIKGSLSYLANPNADQKKNPLNLSDFFKASTSVNATVYMSEFNVPTSYYTYGFRYTDGSGDSQPITDSKGNTLIEYFGLKLDTKLRLTPWERPGLKQFALLSDDGAIMQIDQGQGLRTIINGDGSHPSALSCASTAVWIGQGIEYPIHVEYYQGPRYHIALMLLWRDVPDLYGNGSKSSPIKDPSFLSNETSCGKLGNDTFFRVDEKTGSSTAQDAFIQLIKDGWEVVPATDFILPGKSPVNPCIKK